MHPLPIVRSLIVGALLTAAASGQSADFAPAVVGPGHPTAVNLHGQIVGWRSELGVVRAFVASTISDELLPLPPGFQSSRADDINDHGVVVGTVASSLLGGTGVPARWTPTPDGWLVDLFDPLPGSNFAVATAINNVGDVVGYSIATGFMGGPPTWFTAPGGSMNLSTVGFSATPNDINDARVVVGGQLRMDLDDMVVENLGVPTGEPQNYLWTTAFAINEAGQVASTAYLATSSTSIRIARHTDGVGWELLSPSGPLNTVFGIDEAGSVLMQFGAGAALPMGLYRDGIGLQSVDSLVPTGWQTFSNWSGGINAAGQLVVEGAQSGPGGDGGVLLLTPSDGQVVALGCGTNPAGSLVQSGGSAQPGATLQLSVDDPTAAQAPGSLTVLAISAAAASPVPCGVELPGFGMAPGAPGTLHLDLASPTSSLTGGASWTGAAVAFDLPIPASAVLSGQQLLAQGALLDGTSGLGVDVGLTEAVTITFGL